VVTADGRISRSGGKVVKNVAGYDLCKLYIGSLGTLGIIVEATFKLFPVPQTVDGVELEFASIEEISEFTAEIRRRGLAVTSIDIRRMTQPDSERYVPVSGYICGVSVTGNKAAVDRSMREIRAIAMARQATTFDARNAPAHIEKPPKWALAEEPLTCQASVLPSVVPALVHAFEDEAPGPFLNVDPALGAVTGTWLGATGQAQLVERLRAATRKLGGSLVVRGCSPELKREIDVFGPPPPSFPLMRAIKQQFDPNNVLSPGRFVGRL
jgi:glycolate oxidase FAD binding subunit